MQSVAEVAPCSWAYRSSLRSLSCPYASRRIIQRGARCDSNEGAHVGYQTRVLGLSYQVLIEARRPDRASPAWLPPTPHPHPHSTPSVRVRRKTQSHRSGHGFDSRHSSKRTNGRSVKSGASRVSIWLAGWRLELETKTAEPKKQRRASSASLDLQP